VSDSRDLPVIIDDDPARLPPALRDTLDGRARRAFLRTWPPQRLLPDAEPAYVRSWFYVFGVATLAALVMLCASGIVLAVFGPEWWLKSRLGAWFGALHYWSVQLFFLLMFAHFVAVFVMGAFRGRKVTWALGMLSFAVSAVTGLTGFASLQNFEGQWVTTQAKDAMNAAGVGGILNLLDTGRILTLHVVVLPLLVVGLVGLHVLWVRKHGVVPPYDARPEHLSSEEGAT
jgi:quinol-cytochrome oxidoreductase complex cytochrome b subunit